MNKANNLKLAGLTLLTLIFLLPLNLFAQTKDELKSELQEQIKKLNLEIEEFERIIEEKKKTATTLKSTIDVLNKEVKKRELEIKKIEIYIKNLEGNIKDKEEEINKMEEKRGRELKVLSETLKTLAQDKNPSLIEIILTRSSLSKFFEEINALETLEQRIVDSLSQIRKIRIALGKEKENLEEEVEESQQLQKIQELQKISLVGKKKEKDDLLKLTKGEEIKYQALLKKTQQDIAEIKRQLYKLEGLGVSMSLEDALRLGHKIASSTGIRPAFLLAILKIESNLGKNVGTGNWKQDMHQRDKDAFLKITSELGLNPDETPVSRKPSYGWGGAMGPAQFLPSVWLLYKDAVAKVTGHNPPSPWNIEDAFTAAALKLKNAGADAQTANSEWKAAMIYFAGKNWNKPQFKFYGDSVMELAKEIQEQANKLGIAKGKPPLQN